MKIDMSCCMCLESKEFEFDAGEWGTRYGKIGTDTSFCPKHAKIEDWAGSQCPGCVGGFADCSLWRAFAYDDSDGLSQEQYSEIEKGICPIRTNGTMMFSQETGQTDIDLSEIGSCESGKIFTDAIKDYRKTYFDKKE